MKPFNLKEALAGKPVVTRSGLPVTQLINLETNKYPLVGVVSGYEEPQTFTLAGSFMHSGYDYESSCDLFMATTKKTGWIAYGPYYHVQTTGFTTNVWLTEETAKHYYREAKSVEPLGTVEVSWEE